MDKINLKNTKKQDILFVFLMLSALVLCLWRCSFGFGGGDESFYYALSHRLYQGDALFRDEWHVSQMSAVLLLPFTWVYETINGSAEGIMYAGRLTYVIFHFLVCIYVYLRLRKYGYLMVFASVSYFIFAPNEITAYYYNTFALDGVVICSITMAENRKKNAVCSLFSGIAFSCAVLCCPYLAVAFPAFWILVLFGIIKKEKVIFSLKEAIWFTLGVCISAASFFVYLLSKIGLGEIFYNLPQMLQDGEHNKIPIMYKLRMMFYYYTGLETVPDHFAPSLASVMVLITVLILDRNRVKRREIYIGVSVLLSVWTIIMFGESIAAKFMNMAMLPMAYVGVTSFILLKKKPYRLFFSLYMVGFMHAIVLQFSSNQYFFVLAMALSSSGIAGYVFLSRLLVEMKEDGQVRGMLWVKTATTTLIVVVLAIQVYTKLNNCYFETESPVSGMKYEMTEGPAKNIRTDRKKYEDYMSVKEDLAHFAEKEPGKLLVYDVRIWPYLYLDKFECGAYSAWLAGYGNADGIDHLLDYYRMNPNKIPQYVYIVKDNEEGLKEKIYQLSEEYSYSVIENDVSYKLEKII